MEKKKRGPLREGGQQDFERYCVHTWASDVLRCLLSLLQLVKQVGTQLEQAYLSALEEVKSPGSGKPDPFAGASCAAAFYAVLLWGIADILDFGIAKMGRMRNAAWTGRR